MKNILLESFYVLCGLITYYIGIKTLASKENTKKITTAIFWLALGTLLTFGKILTPLVSGIIVLVMALPAMFNQVKMGTFQKTEESHKEKMAGLLGNKVFLPSFTIGIVALIFAIFIPQLGALVGMGIGTILAAIMILVLAKDKPQYVLSEGRNLLETIGPIMMLPQLLASLGAIFTQAGVGEVIAQGVGQIIPEGNILVGIIVYCVAMALFTMIMGNAFAAFSVITVGIGIPFVLNFGGDPSLLGILALTSGYCGTLMTPMAANFNIVPVAVLEMKDKYGVIKKQVPVALCMLAFQILLMNVLFHLF